MSSTCVWEYDEDCYGNGLWNTECKYGFKPTCLGDPDNDRFKFCPFCGRKISIHESDSEKETVKEEIIFGVCSESLRLYITPKKVWKENGYMFDQSHPDAMKTLRSIGFDEIMEGVYEDRQERTKQEIIDVVEKISNFEHSQDFEDFIIQCFTC